MKKIVIAPVFCETHLIKLQIPNIIETLDPDYIIYNEGMFPKGPESSTKVDDNFIKNYTLDGKRGFDYEELKQVVKEAQEKYPNIKIILNEMNYPDGLGAPEAYYMGCSNFEDFGIEIEEGDLIFPYEGDVFHLEKSKKEIEGYINQLEPDTGFSSIWVDFIETQHFCEGYTIEPLINGGKGKHRKICIKYGTDRFYKEVLLNFMTQKYPMLYPTDLITYHYCWWRPGKYKQLRYDQLNRKPEYWEDWDKALNEIRSTTKTKILIRPSYPENHSWRYVYKFPIEHPEIIKQHQNYLT